MKYRRKPEEIEAIKWTGKNDLEIEKFLGEYFEYVYYSSPAEQYKSKLIYIRTLGGTKTVSVGDYIIKGIQGDFYPCDPDIFEQIYEEVKEE